MLNKISIIIAVNIMLSGCISYSDSSQYIVGYGKYKGEANIKAYGNVPFGFDHTFPITTTLTPSNGNNSVKVDTTKIPANPTCTWKGKITYSISEANSVGKAKCYIPEGGGWCNTSYNLKGILLYELIQMNGITKFICPKGDVIGMLEYQGQRRVKN